MSNSKRILPADVIENRDECPYDYGTFCQKEMRPCCLETEQETSGGFPSWCPLAKVSEGLEQLKDDMNAFNQLKVIRLNKRVGELKAAIYKVCVEYHLADCSELLVTGSFVNAIIELGKVHNSDQ